MADYLSVPQKRRDRATHDKARSLRADELRWVRVYTDDLDDLAGEPLGVRFLDEAIVRLASRRGWMIPNDPVKIAGRLEARPRDVRPAIDRLLALRRLELVHVDDDRLPTGDVQIGLDLRPDPQAEENTVMAPRWSGDGPAMAPRWSGDGEAMETVSAQVADSLRSVDPQQGHQRRGEGEKKELSTSNGTEASSAAAPIPVHTNELVNRLVALVCRGQPASIAVIHHEAQGLPDAAIARTIESVLGRRPRPRDPAPYAVATLRHLRAETGRPDPRPRIEREPPL